MKKIHHICSQINENIYTEKGSKYLHHIEQFNSLRLLGLRNDLFCGSMVDMPSSDSYNTA